MPSPKRDEELLSRMARFISERPREMLEIRKEFKMPKRTAYRRIKYLETYYVDSKGTTRVVKIPKANQPRVALFFMLPPETELSDSKLRGR